MLKFATSSLLAIGLLVAPLVHAQAADARPGLLVLDLEAKGATPLQAEAATLGVVRGVRALDVFQVLSADDARRLLALERSRQLVGESSTGFDLSRALGAPHSIVGSVVQLLPSTQLQVELRLLDTTKGEVVNQKSLGPFDSMTELATAMPGMSQELVAPLLRAQQGSLLVRTREEGAEIQIDDLLVGSTPLEKPLLLSRGMHRMVVKKDGFIAQAKTVRIQPDQLTEEELTLVASPDYADAWKLRHGRLRTGAWIASSVALAAIGGAVLLDRQLLEPTYRNEFLPRQLALSQASSRQISDAGLSAAQESTRRSCGADTATCRQELENISGPLRIQQGVTFGVAALGLAAVGTASYLWLSGEDPNRYAGLVASVSWLEGPGFAAAFRF